MRPAVFLRAEHLCIALLCALGCGGPPAPHPSDSGSATQSNHATGLIDLDNQLFDPWQNNQSDIVVAVFTRTDCPISNRYAPTVRRLDDKYRTQGVRIFLIYVDPSETADAIRAHLKEYDYRCPALRDPKHGLVAKCQATITPEAVVFDKSQSIVYRGRIDDTYLELGKPRSEPTTHDLHDAIESTLHGQPIKAPRTKAVGCRIDDLKD